MLNDHWLRMIRLQMVNRCATEVNSCQQIYYLFFTHLLILHSESKLKMFIPSFFTGQGDTHDLSKGINQFKSLIRTSIVINSTNKQNKAYQQIKFLMNLKRQSFDKEFFGVLATKLIKLL